MDDIEFENFWFTLKRNMCNFYNDENKIILWSDKLNMLKENKEYHRIQLCILEYLQEMVNDLIENYNSRIADIFFVNLKRWNKIIMKTNFLNKYQFYNYLDKFNRIKSTFYLFMKLIEYGYKENISDYYKQGVYNIENLMKIIIKQEQPSMLENLFYLCDMTAYILENYGLDISNMKLTKIIHILKHRV